MWKIAIVTATRAEYGILTPLIRRVADDDDLDLDLIVTGTHLADKHGHTIDEIIRDGFPIMHEIPILDDDNSPYGISVTMSNAVRGFATCFRDDRPDMVVILGDRNEMLGVAAAALNERVPIAHIHGGEVTEGAVDDCIRHALTKMSYLHFASADIYRQRIIQMGEEPERVYNVGSLGTENILTQELTTDAEIRDEIGIPRDMKYAVVTYHPVTMDDEPMDRQLGELCAAMDDIDDVYYVITGSNADTGGDRMRDVLEDYAGSHANACFTVSLGMKRYLSAVKYAACVLGNSSSGIIEAPVLGTPTVNIGDRQRGRIMAETIVCCAPDRSAISEALSCALTMEHTPSYIYGDGHTSELIVRHIKENLPGINLKKGFYDMSLSGKDN